MNSNNTSDVSTRLARWQHKLLDLSLKNPLLALRGNVGLGVWAPHPWALAQMLCDHPTQACAVVACPISEKGSVLEALWATDAHTCRVLGWHKPHPPSASMMPAFEDRASKGRACEHAAFEEPSSVQPKSILADAADKGHLNDAGADTKVFPLAVDTLASGVGGGENNASAPTSETHVRIGRQRLARGDALETDLEQLHHFAQQQRVRQQWPEHVVVVDGTTDALQDQLARMERINRLKEEETGVHVLFLAVGLVQWHDGKSTRLAPLLLVPVSLSRAQVKDAFVLRRHDDEVVLNPALVQVLGQQHSVDWAPVVEALEADRLNINAIVALAQQALGDIGRVREEARLALLSYAKHHMWSDLQARGAHVADHPVVQQIVGNGQMRAQLGCDIAWDALDRECAPDALYLPLPADASQIRAIARVDKGESLVIQGPPGTGKSQTITNLIAHLMARGKRVLFVAEKLTALKVVHQRLDQLGLGAFCLELHTQSSSKTHVLAQLQEALDSRHTPLVHGYHESALALQHSREALNNSLHALHHTYPNGLSVYMAIGRLAHLDDAPSLPGMIFPRVLEESAEVAFARKQAAVTYAQAARLKAPAAQVFDCWHGVALPEDSALWSALTTMHAEVHSCKRGVRGWPQVARLLPEEQWTPDMWQAAVQVAQAWSTGHDIPAQWKKAVWVDGLGEMLDAFKARERTWMAAWTPFQSHVQRSVLKEHLSVWEDMLSIQQGNALQRWWKQRSWLRTVKHHQRREHTPLSVWLAWCVQAPEIHYAHAAVERAAKEMRAAAPKMGWNAAQADLPQVLEWIERTQQWAAQLEEALAKAHAAGIDLQPLCVQALAREDALMPRSWSAQDFQQWAPLEHLCAPLLQHAQVLDQVLRAGWSEVVYDWGAVALAQWETMLGTWVAAQGAWSSWQRSEQHRAQALQYGLAAVVDHIDNHGCSWDQVDKAMDAAYATAFVHAARMSHPEWMSHQGTQRELAIARFQEDSARFDALTQKYVVATMAQRLRHEPIDTWDDMIVFKRETMKKSRHLPTRTLIRRMPKLLPVLKPCLMMSPLSVAEYLSHDVPDFDVVVFDEASQIPTADAIGAVSRAKQVVVVGDPKQMPPSRLFSGDDDGPEDDQLDLDSILTECLGSGMQSVLLNWHYRSRHEHLIAFSNRTYYGGNLITFPSPDVQNTTQHGLVVHDVNGVYDRGGSGTNMDEAKAVVAALIAHIGVAQQQQSIGVVTFNQKQQALIERLWDQALVAHPGLEERMHALHQPVSIKNLESVQGDERDVILFSTTFGRDVQGRFLMNFGPLGQLGGERRLNVAITRARDRMEIFSSFHPHDIDPERITHQGVRDLRAWLLFARGEDVHLLTRDSLGLPDSPFELSVIAALQEQGWTVHPQIGCSGYRIDLAVVDPDNPHRYLAGVECDGATYHSFKTARDRDKQRQAILEALGWRIKRVWSTDWFEDRPREIARLHARLNALRAQRSP